MGFWDRQLTNLEALGIEFSPLFEKVLEEGGRVLRLRHLLTPDSTPEYQEFCYDQNNNPVFVVESIETFRPTGLDPHSKMPVSQVVENWSGDDWKAYPSLIGYLEDEDHFCSGLLCECYRAETLSAYRFWECYPLLEKDLYEVLVKACQDRLHDSLYDEIRMVAEIEWSGDGEWMDIEELWYFFRDPDHLSRENYNLTQEWLDHTDWDRDHIKSVVDAYEKVVEAEYLPPPWHDTAVDGPWAGEHFKIKPMEDYLIGKPFARDVWDTLVAQREYAFQQLESIMTPSERSLFEHYERNTY